MNKSIRELQQEMYEINKSKGWHTLDRRPLEIHALITSEVAEATEAVRAGAPDFYYDGAKPEGESVELADAVIRIMDYFSTKGWDLGSIIEAKAGYNSTRPWLHGKKL
jgi:NTP pyrophosphatase (non-canonical NTP hydrolase)